MVRRACLVLALVGLAACGDDGPDCVPTVYEPIIVRFPIFAPGASVPFADARVRQEYVEFAQPGCGGPQSSTFLRFEPRIPIFVRFGYRLDYQSDFTDWFYVGEVGLNGSLVPTNDVLVSTDPDPIDSGSFLLSFTYFTPF